MNNTIPVYDVVIDDNSIGLTAVSFVKDPAISIDFLAMEKQNVDNNIWFSKHYKHEIVSPVLIPGQLILREAKDGSLYYIRWTEEAIANAAAKYLANGFWNNVTINHPMFYDESLTYDDVLEDDVYLQRMWIVQDTKNDDAKKLYGFDVPKGTLMVKYKIHNKSLWQKIINKEVLGLSIEAFTNIVRSNNDVKLNINMMNLDVTNKQMSLFQKFINFLNEVSSEAKDISDIAKKDETNSGDVSLKYYIDDEHYIEVDAEGFARDEEYNLVAEGEYKLADGNIFVVDSNNKFVETKAVGDENDEKPIEAPIAEKKVEDEDEKDDEKPEGEVDGESGDTESESDAVGDEEGTESPSEENVEPVEEPIEEPVDEIPSTLVPFEIDGKEYLLPQEVIDYINSLKGEGEEIKAELMQMKDKMPSATPIPTVINQSNVESTSNDGMDVFEAVKLLNKKR